MATKRQRNGYLWGVEQLTHTHSDHFQRAMKSNNIFEEEYWYQAVFHAASQAKNLRNEIFQRSIRNNVKAFRDTNNMKSTEPEPIVTFITFLCDLSSLLQNRELKYLAFILIREDLDSHLDVTRMIDNLMRMIENVRLRNYEKYNSQDLYDWMRTRWQADIAHRNIRNILTTYCKELLS